MARFIKGLVAWLGFGAAISPGAACRASAPDEEGYVARSAQGRVATTHPDSSEPRWQWEARTRAGEGFSLENIVWSLRKADDAIPELLYYAKEYSVTEPDSETECTAEPVRDLFASVHELSASPAKLFGRSVCRIDGVGVVGEKRVRLVEFRANEPRHRLIVTILGDVSAVTRELDKAIAWAEKVRFVALQEEND